MPPLDERNSLSPAPALDLLLPRVSIRDAVGVLEVHESHRATTTSIGGTLVVGVVLREAAFEVPRAADVEGPVGTFQDVHERHARSVARGVPQPDGGGTSVGIRRWMLIGEGLRGVSTGSTSEGWGGEVGLRGLDRLDQRRGRVREVGLRGLDRLDQRRGRVREIGLRGLDGLDQLEAGG